MLIERTLDWSGCTWIWSADCESVNQYVWFEHRFSLTELPSSEIILGIACRGLYRLFVNDQEIHNGPCREVPPYISYDVLDLRTYLQTGDNTIRVLVHHAGVNHQSSQAALPGVMFYGDPECSFSQPTAWQSAEDSQHLASWRLGGCLGWAEYVDTSVQSKPGFEHVKILGTHPCEPSPLLLARDYPALGGKTDQPIEIIPQAHGLLCRFEYEVFGFVCLRINTKQAQSIDIAYAEELDENNKIFHKQGMDYRDRLDLAAGSTYFRSFQARAMRYCFISGEDLTIELLQIEEHLYPFQTKARASNPEDQILCDISERSIRLCSEDLQVDCPWRERGQYLDHYAIIGAMHCLFDDLQPIKKWLRQSARGCKHLGYLPMCYPSAPSQGVIPDFQAVYALALQRYVHISQDWETARICLPAACTAIADLEQALNHDGLLDEVPGWLFIDNSFQLPRRPCSSALNAIYGGALRAIAELYAGMHQQQEAEHYQARYQNLRRHFRAAFVGSATLKDALTDFGPWEWWNHHAIAAGLGSSKQRGQITLHAHVAKADNVTQLAVAHYSRCQVLLNKNVIYDASQHGAWSKPPLDDPQIIPCKVKAGDKFIIIYEHSAIDWEVYLASDGHLQWGDCQASLNDGTNISTELRPYERPHLSQVSVGLAAQHGMLEKNEAQCLLKKCLVDTHYENWRKRTTPVFCEISKDRETLRQNVLPSNTPWAFFPFCCALRDADMLNEAQDCIRKTYQHLIERGASTWWEEWNNGSSLCHAWGAFIAEFLIQDND